MSELIVPILAGLFRLLEALLMLLSSLAVASPHVLQPGYEPTPSALGRFLTWPVRAGARHPRRLAVVLVVVAICVAASWRS